MMANWIPDPLTLRGKIVDLISFEEKDLPELKTVAKEKRIWEFFPADYSDPAVLQSNFMTSLIDRQKGTQFPFVVFSKQSKKIIGSTRFLDIQQKHRKLEIGATWYHPNYWATAVNLECKLLMLNFCFDELRTVRVQLKTDENNLRSRRAIEKIGGQFEGVLRNDMVRDNGTLRNSAYYSIVEAEWVDKKEKLMQLLRNKLSN